MRNQIILGNVLYELPKLPSESVNCCVTSPPYWSLRDYGIEGQLGLEKTFEEYITKLCDIFDEVKRVLRKDGTCWVNLGDSYGGSGNASGHTEDTKNLGYKTSEMGATKGHTLGLTPKSLCLIPQRFAIEMVNRGWILRNTIIWHKPNCMPSSAKDRFTVDFEYVYFFVKNKKYWFEQQFEAWTDTNINDTKRAGKYIQYGGKHKDSEDNKGVVVGNPEQGRNRRCVWKIPTKSFKEAHFAVYPEALIAPMIQAGCPRYVCKKCGKARVKIMNRDIDILEVKRNKRDGDDDRAVGGVYQKFMEDNPIKFKGYTDCGCNAGFEGGIVIDPFMGAGTTAVVAKKQGKRYIGIEIKQEYIDMANKRIRKIPELLF